MKGWTPREADIREMPAARRADAAPLRLIESAACGQTAARNAPSAPPPLRPSGAERPIAPQRGAIGNSRS